MAIAEELKEQILADYYTNTFSQRELAQKHCVGIGTINRLTKGLETKNGTLVCESVDTTIKQNELMEQIGTLNGTERNSVQKAIQDQLRRSELVYGLAEKALNKIGKALSKTVTIKEEDKEDREEEVEHSSKDIKEYVEAIDKASITLNVNQRHANSQIQINNQNNQDNKTLTIEDLYN